MPSILDTIDSGGAFDSFLIDAAPTRAPRHVAALDDFLAAPPVPDSLSGRQIGAEDAGFVHPTASRLFIDDEAIRAADLPLARAFTIESAAPPNVGGDGSIFLRLAAGVEQGRGGGVLPALAAGILDDALLADPSALLPSISTAAPAVDDGESAGDWFAPWPSTPLAASGRDAGSRGLSAFDARPGGDDRSSDDSQAIDRIEGRLSQAVARLEEAVAAFSTSGPPPLGSRPRGFRGRIDA